MNGCIGAGILSTLMMAVATSLLGCIPTELTKTVSPYSGTVRDVAVADHGQSKAGFPLTASETRMRQQSRNFDRTIWEGVLIGAVGGAIWGLIEGGDTSELLKRVGIGAAVGGLAGAYIAHKQKQYSETEDQLESMTVDVRESNEDAEALIASAREVLAEDKRRLAAVNKRYRQGAASHEEMKRERARLAANRKVLTNAVDGGKEKYTMFQGAKHEYKKQNPEVDVKRLDRELETYNEHIETLDGLAESMSVA